MATTARASVPVTRPAGPAWSPNFLNKAENSSCLSWRKFSSAGKSAVIWTPRKNANGWSPMASAGYASGTVAGTATRRYHGLLVAALSRRLDAPCWFPGSTRASAISCLLLPRHQSLDEWFYFSEWLSADGKFSPGRTKPVWRYAFADAMVEKRVWMAQGENTTYVQYSLVRASGPVELDGKVLVNYRDFHDTTHADDWQMSSSPSKMACAVDAFEGAVPFVMKSAGACFPAPARVVSRLLAARRSRARTRRQGRSF